MDSREDYLNSIEELQKELNLRSGELGAIIERRDKALSEIGTLEKAKLSLLSAIDTLKKEHDEKYRILKSHSKNITEKSIQAGDIEGGIIEGKKFLRELKNQIETDVLEADSLIAKINTLTTEKDSLDKMVNDLKPQLNQLKTEIDAAEKQLKKTQDSIAGELADLATKREENIALLAAMNEKMKAIYFYGSRLELLYKENGLELPNLDKPIT